MKKFLYSLANIYSVFTKDSVPLLVVGYVFLIIFGNFEIACLYPENLFRVIVFFLAIFKGCVALKNNKDVLFSKNPNVFSFKEIVTVLFYTIIAIPCVFLSLSALLFLILELLFSK